MVFAGQLQFSSPSPVLPRCRDCFDVLKRVAVFISQCTKDTDVAAWIVQAQDFWDAGNGCPSCKGLVEEKRIVRWAPCAMDGPRRLGRRAAFAKIRLLVFCTFFFLISLLASCRRRPHISVLFRTCQFSRRFCLIWQWVASSRSLRPARISLRLFRRWVQSLANWRRCASQPASSLEALRAAETFHSGHQTQDSRGLSLHSDALPTTAVRRP